MITATETILSTPVEGFQRVHEEYRTLLEDRSNGLPYEGGASLAPSDIVIMKTVLHPDANINFWKPCDHNTQHALRNGLKSGPEEYSTDIDTLLNENINYKKTLTERHCPTIEDAYSASISYSSVIEYLMEEGLFHNEDLLDVSGNGRFKDLGVSYIRSHIHMETRVVFGTPSFPHITILSIQPQRAPTPTHEKLLYTESWTLYHWARKLARRTLHMTDRCLPIRLVSLCGYEARVISAAFSLEHVRSVANEMGQGKDRIAKCQIHIAEYRDLSVRENLYGLMEELVATPCGDAEVQQTSLGENTTWMKHC